MAGCCVYSVEYVSSDGRRGERGYPRGCTPCSATLSRRVQRRPLRYRREGRFCIVEEPYKLVAPRDACRILDLVREGRTGRFLFLGPPGTGKSRMLKVVAETALAHTVLWKPEESLGRYVGDAEKAFKRVLREAERMAPSWLLIDEGDLVIQPRTGGGGDGYQEVSRNLVNMFLTALQTWSDTGAEVGVIVTTNKPIREISTAIVRGERLEPVYFPAPDREAVKILARMLGREISDSEAVEVASRAASFPNVIEYLKTGRLKEFKPGRWVKLVYVDCSRLRPMARLSDRARVVVAERPPVGFYAAALLSCLWDSSKPVVALLEPRQIEDGVYTAEAMEAALAVPYSPIVAESMVYDELRYPVFLVGPEWGHSLVRVTLDEVAQLVGGWSKAAEALGVKRWVRTREALARALSGIEATSYGAR